MMKNILRSVFVLILSAYILSAAESKAQSETLSSEDQHALEVGRKVIAIRESLKSPEHRDAIKTVTSLGLDSRDYVMVRGWITQHIRMTESYRGTSDYKESEERKIEVESRIEALQKMIRAIDLE